jgi:hypothetical protein
MRQIASLATALLVSACLTAGPGGCSPEEAAAFNEIDHYGDETLVPQDHPYGICGATFTSDADPDLIVAHYQDVLSAAGWTVQDPESFPITAEGGDQLGTSLNLGATKGSMTFSLGAELLLDGAEPPTFNVLVGESGS